MTFVYIFVGFIAIMLFIASLLPKGFNIEKTIVIHQPVEVVMDHVGDLHHYRDWNPWQKMDPSSKTKIEGQVKTAGHKYSWHGKKVGIGSLTLLNIDNKHIHFELEFIKPFKSKAKDNWLFEHWGQSDTKVTWQNSGELPFPVARLMGPALSKSLNKQFEQGLKNLKNMCEAKA